MSSANEHAKLLVSAGLRADGRTVKSAAQKLVDGIDGMLWALQSMSEGDDLRAHLVECKSKLKDMLEAVGYTLKVQGGFKTTVTKVRKPRSTRASRAADRIIRAADADPHA